MRSFRLDDLPAGRLRTAAVRAYARAEAERIGGELELPAARGRSDSPARGRTPPRTPNPRRYHCRRCGAYFGPWAPAERHADTHGGATIELDVSVL